MTEDEPNKKLTIQVTLMHMDISGTFYPIYFGQMVPYRYLRQGESQSLSGTATGRVLPFNIVGQPTPGLQVSGGASRIGGGEVIPGYSPPTSSLHLHIPVAA